MGAGQRARQIPPRPPANADDVDARERILRTAYELFTQHGLVGVGVDRIVAEAGVAKTTLYRHFGSKDGLAVAVLERHEELWTRKWLQSEVERLASSHASGPIAIFDALDEWFGQADYEGCLFINSLLETRDHASPVRQAAIAAIERVYEVVQRLLEVSGVLDSEARAHQIQIVMRGCIVAAVEGHLDAVRQGRRSCPAAPRGMTADPFASLSADERALLRPARLPEKVEPMKAVLTEERFSDPAWVFERKLDGIRCIAIKAEREVRLLSRNDLSLNRRFPEVAAALEADPATQLVLDGEVVAFAGGKTSFELLQQRGERASRSSSTRSTCSISPARTSRRCRCTRAGACCAGPSASAARCG